VIVKIPDCAREREVVRAILSRGREGLDDELRSHADSCEVCRDVVALVPVLRDDRDEMIGEERLPGAGQIWWRSALRAHAEATAAARRPMLWLQGIAGACAAGVVAAILGLLWPSLYDTTVAIAAIPATFAPEVLPIVEALRPVLPVALAVVACLVLTPIVVYLALSDE
jgi:hypothetical protein